MEGAEDHLLRESGEACEQLAESYQAKIDDILSHTPEENKEKVRSTLVSFAFLHQNAFELSKLPCVSQASITDRAELLFLVLDALDIPDCPELLEEILPPEMIPFQKVNRNLFGAFDEEVKKIFTARNPNFPEDFLAYPIVEWAVNIIPTFTFQLVIDGGAESFEKDTVHFIRENYTPDSLQVFLSQAWALIDAKWPPKKGIHSWKGKGGIFERLGCSMCFPARASILEK